jgi:hypothetical protein
VVLSTFDEDASPYHKEMQRLQKAYLQSEKDRDKRPATYRCAVLKVSPTATLSPMNPIPHRGGGTPIGVINKDDEGKLTYRVYVPTAINYPRGIGKPKERTGRD